jgi:hypothetical protein
VVWRRHHNAGGSISSTPTVPEKKVLTIARFCAAPIYILYSVLYVIYTGGGGRGLNKQKPEEEEDEEEEEEERKKERIYTYIYILYM